MMTHRCNVVIAAAVAATVTGCGKQPVAVDPKTATLRELVDSGVRNPELTDLLNKRIDFLNSDPARLERELLSSAAQVVMTPDGCGTWQVVGSKRSFLGRDDTVRAAISLCPNARARLRTTTVTFGPA